MTSIDFCLNCRREEKLCRLLVKKFRISTQKRRFNTKQRTVRTGGVVVIIIIIPLVSMPGRRYKLQLLTAPALAIRIHPLRPNFSYLIPQLRYLTAPIHLCPYNYSYVPLQQFCYSDSPLFVGPPRYMPALTSLLSLDLSLLPMLPGIFPAIHSARLVSLTATPIALHFTTRLDDPSFLSSC